MSLHRLAIRATGILMVAATLPTGSALAQSHAAPSGPATRPPAPPASTPVTTLAAPEAPPAGEDDDSFITDKQARQHKAEMERELRKLRVKYFGSMRKIEIRQEGISRLRTYTDPLIFPALVTIFEREQHDVRMAILDHLVEQKSQEGDVTLAWIAAFDKDEMIRQEALYRVRERMAVQKELPQRIKYMIYQALRSGSDEKINGAAQLAESLKFFDAIPWLITAQFGGPNSGGGGTPEPRGDLAWIVVGTQTAFVSDLTPVVGDSAVAFDPTLSTLTTGTILRVQDAVVTTYRTIIQTVLVNMSSEAWGKPTDGLGFSGPRWWKWYREDYLPFLGEKLARESGQTSKDAAPEAPAMPPGPAKDAPAPR